MLIEFSCTSFFAKINDQRRLHESFGGYHARFWETLFMYCYCGGLRDDGVVETGSQGRHTSDFDISGVWGRPTRERGS
jgi:hypothetical protein